jgi:hypothetical protein
MGIAECEGAAQPSDAQPGPASLIVKAEEAADVKAMGTSGPPPAEQQAQHAPDAVVSCAPHAEAPPTISAAPRPESEAPTGSNAPEAGNVDVSVAPPATSEPAPSEQPVPDLSLQRLDPLPAAPSEAEPQHQPQPDSGSAIATLLPGDVVWAKVNGYPEWPAFVVTPEHAANPEAAAAPPSASARKSKASKARPGGVNLHGNLVPIVYFGTFERQMIKRAALVPFEVGVEAEYQLQKTMKRRQFAASFCEVQSYLQVLCSALCPVPVPVCSILHLPSRVRSHTPMCS